jgi:ribokinase
VPSNRGLAAPIKVACNTENHMRTLFRLLAAAVEGVPAFGPFLREIVEIGFLSDPANKISTEALETINNVLQRTKSRQFDVIALSACNYDHFVKVDKILPDYECKVKGEDAHPGGSGANSIYGLAKLGKKTAIAGCVKDDEEGREIVQSFNNSLPIDTQLLVIDNTIHSRTGRTTIFVENSGKRLIAVKPGINESFSRIFQEEQLKKKLRSAVKNSRIIHLSSFTGDQEMELQELVLQDFKEEDTIVSFTPGSLYVEKGLEELSPILAHTNIMFLYVEQLDTLLKSSSKKRYFRKNLSLKRKAELFFNWKLSKRMDHAMIIVIKDNLKIQSGCILENYISVASNAGDSIGFFSHSNVRFSVGDGSRVALDTTGAGDAVVAAFLYGLLEQENIETCADLSFVLATHVSTRFGARAGLLDSASLREEKRKLQSSSL